MRGRKAQPLPTAGNNNSRRPVAESMKTPACKGKDGSGAR
jgi:hypothetical protein